MPKAMNFWGSNVSRVIMKDILRNDCNEIKYALANVICYWNHIGAEDTETTSLIKALMALSPKDPQTEIDKHPGIWLMYAQEQLYGPPKPYKEQWAEDAEAAL
jgi:hypothetical protein